MDEKDNKGTFITDSNVDILIENGTSQVESSKNKKTDYWPLLIIAAIMVAMALYGLFRNSPFIRGLFISHSAK